MDLLFTMFQKRKKKRYTAKNKPEKKNAFVLQLALPNHSDCSKHCNNLKNSFSQFIKI